MFGVTFAVDDDFTQRPADGSAADEPPLRHLRQQYELAFPVGTEGKDKIVSALLDGSADVGELFGTDGQIAEYDLVVLEDNLGFFPVYDAAPLVRSDALANLPGLREALQKLGRVRSPPPTCRP